MMSLIKAFVILGLAVLNAFFVAAEYALLSVRRSRLEQLALEGDERARQVQTLLANIRLLFSGTQLGVTIVSLLMGWLGEGFIAQTLQPLLDLGLHRHASAVLVHSLAGAIAFLLITIFLMVLGELVPKAVAYDHGRWFPWLLPGQCWCS